MLNVEIKTTEEQSRSGTSRRTSFSSRRPSYSKFIPSVSPVSLLGSKKSNQSQNKFDSNQQKLNSIKPLLEEIIHHKKVSKTKALKKGGHAADTTKPLLIKRTISIPEKMIPVLEVEIADKQEYTLRELSQDIIENNFIKNFGKRSSAVRQNMLLQLIKEFDPSDMTFLNAILPRYHRDFFALLDRKIIFRIVNFMSPKDTVCCSKVSKTWFNVISSQELWHSLYGNVGLATMAHKFYLKDGTVAENAQRYHSLSNWAHGIFSYRNYRAHSLSILCMSFDGKTVATGSSDKTAKVFSLKNGSCLRSLEGHGESVTAIQHNDSVILTGCSDGVIRLWSNKGSGALLSVLKGHDTSVTSLKLDNQKFVSGSIDKTVRLWNVSSDITKAPETVKSVSIRPKKDTTFTAGCERVLHGHQSAVKAVDFHGHCIVSGDIRGEVIFWHMKTGNFLNRIGFHPDFDRPIQIGMEETYDPNHLPICTDPIAEIQYTGSRMLVATMSGYAFFNDMTPQPDCDKNMSADFDKYCLWSQNPKTYSQKRVFNLRKKSNDTACAGQTSVAWSLCCKSDEWRLMAGGSNGYLQVFNHRIEKFLYKLQGDVEVGEKRSDIRPGSFAALRAQFRPTTIQSRTLTGLSFDDSIIVAVGNDGKIHIWDPF